MLGRQHKISQLVSHTKTQTRLLKIVAVGFLFLLLFLFIPILDRTLPWQEEIRPSAFIKLEVFSEQISLAEIKRILPIVDPHNVLAPYYQLDKQYLTIYANPQPHTSSLVKIALSSERLNNSKLPKNPIKKILLDPGHYGGAWSQIEKRHFDIPNAEPIQEGNLNYATASLLQRQLQNKGFRVRLTRPPPPSQPFPLGIDPRFQIEREAQYVLHEQMIQGQHQFWERLYPTLLSHLYFSERINKIADELPWELYRRFDLKSRAKQANIWQPDLSISIHYNTTGIRDQNFILVFVPGNLLPHEATSLSQRYYAFRRILDGTLLKSIELANCLAQSMKKHLKVQFPDPTRFQKRPVPYKWPLNNFPGVYARNLAILKRTSGIVVLTEGPCVNQSEEKYRLKKHHIQIGQHIYPLRAKEYSDALFSGIQKWLH